MFDTYQCNKSQTPNIEPGRFGGKCEQRQTSDEGQCNYKGSSNIGRQDRSQLRDTHRYKKRYQEAEQWRQEPMKHCTMVATGRMLVGYGVVHLALLRRWRFIQVLGFKLVLTATSNKTRCYGHHALVFLSTFLNSLRSLSTHFYQSGLVHRVIYVAN